ncbi:MAG: glycosyltransferase family 39 protein [bacterium]|nr:glycosyltransferase family 39 protein [bacterium]
MTRFTRFVKTAFPASDFKNFAGRNLVLLLGVAFLIRIVFFAVALENGGTHFGMRFPDSWEYDQLARNLVAGNGFSLQSQPPYEPDTFRTPSYPVFLAVVYGVLGYRPHVAVFFQSFIGVLTCMLTVLLERQVSAGNRSGYLSGWVLAIYPLSVVYNNALLTESLFTFLLVASVYYFVKLTEKQSIRSAVLCGLFLGVTALCKPIAAYLIVLFIAVLVVLKCIQRYRGSWKHVLWVCLCLYAGFFVVIFPWIMRNHYQAGRSQLSLLSASTDTWMRPLSYVRSFHSGRQYTEEYLDILKEYESLSERSDINPEVARRIFFRQAIGEIWNAQPPYWRLHAWGILITLLSPQTHTTRSLLGVEGGAHINARSSFATLGFWGFIRSLYQKKTALELMYIVFSVFMSLGVYALALYCLFKHRRSPIVIVFFLIVLYLIFPPGAIGDGRYRVPAMPYIAVLCSWGGYDLMKRIFHSKYRTLAGSNDVTK